MGAAPMDDGLLLQYVLVALAVAASAGYVAIKRFPASVRKLRVAVALPLLREGRAGWLHGLGRRIAPAPSIGTSGSCGGCNGCDPAPGAH
jgi:hypothetical protein